MRIAIIGGGAAGFFAAITAAEKHPGANVTIFERAPVTLSKVRISGGGRCNLTNSCDSPDEFAKAYPRGGTLMKRLLREFGNKSSMEWFQSRGVPLTVQSDGCVFPVSQNSQSIIDCFYRKCRRLSVSVKTRAGAESLTPLDNGAITIHFDNPSLKPETFDKVIVTTGGSPKRRGLEWLEKIGHTIADPAPSLFSLNLPGDSLTSLMGIVAENTLLTIPGTKVESAGALLITHWGISGPAALKLSSYGALVMKERDYSFDIHINWTGNRNEEAVKEALKEIIQASPAKLLSSVRPFDLSSRLWEHLTTKSELPANTRWGDLGKRGVIQLIQLLTADKYRVNGKSSYKDEYVTCGGVSLESVNIKTLQSKHVKNLYFAGEVLDIDAITGGFNLQCAWTTGYICGLLRE